MIKNIAKDKNTVRANIKIKWNSRVVINGIFYFYEMNIG